MLAFGSNFENFNFNSLGIYYFVCLLWKYCVSLISEIAFNKIQLSDYFHGDVKYTLFIDIGEIFHLMMFNISNNKKILYWQNNVNFIDCSITKNYTQSNLSRISICKKKIFYNKKQQNPDKKKSFFNTFSNWNPLKQYHNDFAPSHKAHTNNSPSCHSNF